MDKKAHKHPQASSQKKYRLEKIQLSCLARKKFFVQVPSLITPVSSFESYVVSCSKTYRQKSLSQPLSLSAFSLLLHDSQITGSIAQDPLHNHLCDTSATKGLASNECLALESSKAVADGRERQENGSSNQTRAHNDDAEELDQGHDAVGTRPNVVGGNLPDELVELGGCRADPKQKRHFNEQDDER